MSLDAGNATPIRGVSETLCFRHSVSETGFTDPRLDPLGTAWAGDKPEMLLRAGNLENRWAGEKPTILRATTK
jgi:hypothetical protein